MSHADYQPGFHRLAVLTACVALVPITVGALVTTLQAGMAFLDWPTSDGHSMFFYPWLESFALADKSKFVEHGHRLAGIVIGILSIALAGWAVRWERRRWVRLAAVIVLAGVVLQGLLGGIRVRLDSARFAMLHGSFAAIVFALMCAVALVTSRKWFSEPPRYRDRDVSHLKPFAMILIGAISMQYVLGGLLRHEGKALYEHIGFGILVGLAATVTGIAALMTKVPWLRRSAVWLLGLVALQLCLGAGAFVTKYGLASLGYVAVYGSVEQTIVRTSHTVVGMLVFMSSVNLAVRVFRLDYLREQSAAGVTPGGALERGGVA